MIAQSACTLQISKNNFVFSQFHDYTNTSFTHFPKSSIIRKRLNDLNALRFSSEMIITWPRSQTNEKIKASSSEQITISQSALLVQVPRLGPCAGGSAQGVPRTQNNINCSRVMAFPRVVGQFSLKCNPAKICFLASSRSRCA